MCVGKDHFRMTTSVWTIEAGGWMVMSQAGEQGGGTVSPGPAAGASAAPPAGNVNVVGLPGPGSATTGGGAVGQPGTVGVPAGGGGVGATPVQRPPDFTFFWVMMGGMLLFMILINVFTGRKEKKRRAELMSSLKKGDKVALAGGIIGHIAEMDESTAVIRLEDGRMRVSRNSIQQVLEKGRD
jgi:preprotein translocase subunit YajC